MNPYFLLKGDDEVLRCCREAKRQKRLETVKERLEDGVTCGGKDV